MATKEALVAQRGGQRTSATRLISSTEVERGDIEGADLEVFDTVCKKLADKLNKIKILDSQILERLTEESRN